MYSYMPPSPLHLQLLVRSGGTRISSFSHSHSYSGTLGFGLREFVPSCAKGMGLECIGFFTLVGRRVVLLLPLR